MLPLQVLFISSFFKKSSITVSQKLISHFETMTENIFNILLLLQAELYAWVIPFL